MFTVVKSNDNALSLEPWGSGIRTVSRGVIGVDSVCTLQDIQELVNNGKL